MIYAQTSRLKASDINDSTAITLMGTDVERVVQSQKTIHETWASILEVGIAIWLLERQLSVSCVVPAVIAIGRSNPSKSYTGFNFKLTFYRFGASDRANLKSIWPGSKGMD